MVRARARSKKVAFYDQSHREWPGRFLYKPVNSCLEPAGSMPNPAVHGQTTNPPIPRIIHLFTPTDSDQIGPYNLKRNSDFPLLCRHPLRSLGTCPLRSSPTMSARYTYVTDNNPTLYHKRVIDTGGYGDVHEIYDTQSDKVCIADFKES